MSDSTITILGGVEHQDSKNDKDSDTLNEFDTGLQSQSKKHKHKIFNIGNQTEYKYMDKSAELEEYLNVETQDTDNVLVCGVMKSILNSTACLNLQESIIIINGYLDLGGAELAEVFIDKYDLKYIFVESAQALFKTWVMYIEKLMVMYINYRNAYIQKHKLQKTDSMNHMDELYENWMAIDKYYKIETSSPVLLYANFPSIPYDLPWLRQLYTEDDIWEVKPTPIHLSISKLPQTKKLEDAIKNFTYLGFCPRRPLYRLQKLFEFPIEELILSIDALSQKKYKSQIPEYCRIFDSIKNYEEFPVIDIEFKKEKLPDTSDKIYLRSGIQELISRLAQLHPYFKSVENYYEELSKIMSKCSFNILKLYK